MAVLLVGLGGTGGEVLRIVKDKMKDSPYKNDVAYYYLDSRARAGDGFDAGEFCHIGGFRVSDVVRDHKSTLRKWWYPLKPPDTKQYAPDYETTDGAGQTRLIGRLCFYLHADEIRTDINDLLTRKLMGGHLDVIAVASTSGGTGSGMFCDVGYLLKDIIGQRRRAKFMGVLLDPSIVRDRISPDQKSKDQSEINGLACLTELEFYMGNSGAYSFEILSQGSAKEVSGNDRLPYDSVVLLQTENTEGYNFYSKEDYFHLQAEGIWHLINISFRELGGRQGGTGLENYFNQLWQPSPINGKTQYYASFGCAAVEFPFSKIALYCKNQYSQAILSKLLSELSADEIKAVESEVAERVLNWGIKESDNSDQLIKEARRILWEINKQWHHDPQKMIEALGRKLIAAERNFQSILETDESALNKDLKVLSEKNLKSELNPIKQKVLKEIDDLINDALKGGQWKKAERLLKELKRTLETERGDLVKTEEESWLKKRNLDSIRTELRRIENEILDLDIGENWPVKPALFAGFFALVDKRAESHVLNHGG